VAVLGETQRDNVRDKMVTHQIQQIPILDNFRRVVGLHLWDEISQSPDRPNIFVVMAGGEGKRLYPFTLARPKPMLEVGGKPVLEHIIVKAKKEGFRQFVIAVRHLGGMIEKFFGCGKNWGINISYLKEQMPLGTAGALRLLKPLPRDPLVVINGDVLADFSYGDLLDFHARHKGDATMAVRLHDWQNPYGVVETQGLKITGLQEKPLVRTQINAGVYVLNPSACRQIPRLIRFDMTDLFRKLRNRKKRTLAYPLHGRWVDIGKPDDLRKAKNSIRK
jgi:NDP-sugar pyrophosphorylase family protein